MWNFGKLLESIEDLVFKIITWIIFIPKTIYKVLLHWEWAPGYVKAELKAEEKERFDEYISPVFLFLAVAILPAAIVSTIDEMGVEIEGNIEGVVHEKQTFRATSDPLTNSLSETYYFSWTFDDETTLIDTVQQKSSVIYNTMEYTWDSIGIYTPYLIVSTDDNPTVYSTLHYITIYNDESEFTGTVPEEAQMNIEEFLNSPEIKLYALGFLVFPLLFTLPLILFRGRVMSYKYLKPNFYLQCLFFSPFILGFWIIVLSGIFLEQSNVIMLLSFFLFLLLTGWFIRVQVNFIAQERKISKLWAFIIFSLTSLFVISVITTLLFIYDHRLLIAQIFGYLIVGSMFIPFLVRLFHYIRAKVRPKKQQVVSQTEEKTNPE